MKEGKKGKKIKEGKFKGKVWIKVVKNMPERERERETHRERERERGRERERAINNYSIF